MGEYGNPLEMGYLKPVSCSGCGGRKLKYTGVGEYVCEDCNTINYDEYGLVRSYIEQHRGATQSEVSMATGVHINKIRQMLRDEKLEITANSAVFLHCEICGKEIRSGHYCEECRMKEEKRTAESSKHHSNVTGGYGKAKGEASGQRRFVR